MGFTAPAFGIPVKQLNFMYCIQKYRIAKANMMGIAALSYNDSIASLTSSSIQLVMTEPFICVNCLCVVPSALQAATYLV